MTSVPRIETGPDYVTVMTRDGEGFAYLRLGAGFDSARDISSALCKACSSVWWKRKQKKKKKKKKGRRKSQEMLGCVSITIRVSKGLAWLP